MKLFEDLSDQQSNAGRPQLAFLFVGQFHAFEMEAIVKQASALLLSSPSKNIRLVSIVGGGVIGDRLELDEPSQPSMSLMVGTLPEGADIELFSFNEMEKPPPSPESEYWQTLGRGSDDDGTTTNGDASYLLLADPWAPVDAILEGLASSSSSGNSPVIVGGISVPVSTTPTVAIDDQALPQGSAVGIAFRGTLGLQAIVAQGCRPVGPTYTVTSCERNCILELDGEPALTQLETFLRTAPNNTEEQRKFSSGLVCGVLSSNEQDYLVRQIVGFVPAKSGVAISGAGSLQIGDRIRFHVRDKATASEDLDLMVKRCQTERLLQSGSGSTPVAAIQVSCVARGRGLFGEPHVDLSHVQELLEGKEGSIGGFYANGEIGPVGVAGFATTQNSDTYLHGFTTVVALLCDTSNNSDISSSTATTEEEESLSDEQVDAWG